MASLFELLLETMPFAGAALSLWKKTKKTVNELSADEAKEHIQLMPEGASFHVELPDTLEEHPPEYRPLWAWSHNSAQPAEVGSVYCRVRDADNVGHHVADRIAWGLDDPPKAFDQGVRVTFQAGAEVVLPLSKDFVLWTFRVTGGHVTPDLTRLWKLESVLDTSLVVVFAYDVDPATGKITKMDFDRISDPILREDVREMETAVKELLATPGATPPPRDGEPSGGGGAEGSGPGTNLPEPGDDEPPPYAPAPSVKAAPQEAKPPESTTPISNDEAWGKKLLKGDFWQTAQAETGPPGSVPVTAGVSGQVGEVRELSTEPARLLVVFSFTTCCERADFEPGGIVGFARCYPHLLVSTTVPVRKIEASARMDRPREISKWHEDGRDLKASCCKPPYDAWTPTIGGLLVSDANENPNRPGPPIPFWSNMFSYYLVDPYLQAQGQLFHIVRRDRPSRRESPGPLLQRKVTRVLPTSILYAATIDDDDDIVKKEARQGAFDNIHLAPRLRLMNVAAIKIPVPGEADFYFKIDDRAKMGFDEIAMAPFCAHDCFHMHWRWARCADVKSTLGWDATGPYRVAGAPMVPHEQDVWLRFRARASISYHVVASQPRFLGNWHVLMHHGFGYAVSIVGAIPSWLAMTAIETFSGFELASENGEVVDARNSTAAYYWTARHGVERDGTAARPFERLTWATADDLAEAIDL